MQLRELGRNERLYFRNSLKYNYQMFIIENSKRFGQVSLNLLTMVIDKTISEAKGNVQSKPIQDYFHPQPILSIPFS